jgi:hypothetical protein
LDVQGSAAIGKPRYFPDPLKFLDINGINPVLVQSLNGKIRLPRGKPVFTRMAVACFFPEQAPPENFEPPGTTKKNRQRKPDLPCPTPYLSTVTE